MCQYGVMLFIATSDLHMHYIDDFTTFCVRRYSNHGGSKLYYYYDIALPSLDANTELFTILPYHVTDVTWTNLSLLQFNDRQWVCSGYERVIKPYISSYTTLVHIYYSGHILTWMIDVRHCMVDKTVKFEPGLTVINASGVGTGINKNIAQENPGLAACCGSIRKEYSYKSLHHKEQN